MLRAQDSAGEHSGTEHREEAAHLQHQIGHLQYAQVMQQLTAAHALKNIYFRREGTFLYSECGD